MNSQDFQDIKEVSITDGEDESESSKSSKGEAVKEEKTAAVNKVLAPEA